MVVRIKASGLTLTVLVNMASGPKRTKIWSKTATTKAAKKSLFLTRKRLKADS